MIPSDYVKLDYLNQFHLDNYMYVRYLHFNTNTTETCEGINSRGVIFASIMCNGRSSGEAYLLFHNTANAITASTRLAGSNSDMTFSLNNGVLTVTCAVNWSYGFIIYNK